MYPRLADLIRLFDGSWELCRTYAWERWASIEDGSVLLCLPLELCPDGTWVLSGLNERKLRNAIGNTDTPIPDVLPRYIDMQLFALQAEGALDASMWPENANPRCIARNYWPALDDLRADIVDLSHALNESDTDLIKRIEEASPISLAGLLRDSKTPDKAYRLLEHCPAKLLPLAEIPLITVKDKQNEPCAISFLRGIENIDWLSESESENHDWTNQFDLDHSVEQWHVLIWGNGLAKVSSSEWMFFGRRFRNVGHKNHQQQLDDVYVIEELKQVPDKVRKLVLLLARARWKNCQDYELPSHLATQVSEIVMKSITPLLRRVMNLASGRIYPFDKTSRAVSYAQFFTGETTPSIRERRIQARGTTPLLAHLAATGRYPLTAKAIDDAQPAIPALANELGMPKWVASRLAKFPEVNLHRDKNYARQANIHPRELSEIANVMLALGPDSPMTRIDAKGSEIGVWRNAERISRILGRTHLNFGLEFFGHAREDTQMMIHAIGRTRHSSAHLNSGEYEEQSNNIISEVASESSRISLYYCIARESIRYHLQFDHDDRASIDKTLSAWMQGLSAAELLTKSHKVASLILLHCKDMIPAQLRATLTGSTQSLLQPHVCKETGVEVVPLTSQLALKDEGERMRHCVGGYWGRVANRQAELFSLRSPHSGKLATLCLAMGTDGRMAIEEFKLTQNRKVTDKHLLYAAEVLRQRLDSVNNVPQSTYSNEYSPTLSMVRLDRRRYALQLQPVFVRQPLLACFPGTGWLETRIERAIALSHRLRQV